MITPSFTMLVDDIDIEEFGMKLVKYEAASYLSRKTTGEDIPGVHGTSIVPSALSARPLTAEVIITGWTADEVHRRARLFFAYMFSTQDAHKIVFTDDMDVVRYAILDAPSNYKVMKGMDGCMAEIKLSMTMANPFLYESDPDIMTLVLNHGQEYQVINDGFECPAIFTIRNPGEVDVTNVSIILNDELATFDVTLTKDDELVFNTKEYEILFNGASRLECWSGDMFLVKNGINKMILQNTEQMPLNVTVEFTKKWI